MVDVLVTLRSKIAYAFLALESWIQVYQIMQFFKIIFHLLHTFKNKKIKIVDGSFSFIIDQRTIKINPTLSLKSMLGVPDLSYSLLSIGKITKDLRSSVIFTSFDCIFHDFVMSMIGHAKEKNGLQYQDANWKTGVLRSPGLVSISSPKVV